MGRKTKPVSQMTEKEKRRQQRKIEKQIAQGKKKIKLPDGRVIDGKSVSKMRSTGNEMRKRSSKMEIYVGVSTAAAIAARVFTSWAIPGGFRVLVFLVCIPVTFGFGVLLSALVPLKVDQQRRLLQEAGGNLLNSVVMLGLTIEVTKFVQFCIDVFRGDPAAEAVAVAAEADGAENRELGAIDFNSDGVLDELDVMLDPEWQPPQQEPNLYKLSAQNGFTRLFLYGIPYMFGAAAVLFFLVALLRATVPDPVFGGSNRRILRVRQPLSSCVVSSHRYSRHRTTPQSWCHVKKMLHGDSAGLFPMFLCGS